MKASIWILAATLLPLVPGRVAAQAVDEPQDTCVACHSALDDELGRPAHAFGDDVHSELGFSCADCHGGDPASLDMEISMSPAKGFLGEVTRARIPELCGGCHADATLMHRFNPRQRVDQLALYRTSVHGQRLAQGDERVAACTDCHSVHDIRRVDHPLSPVHPLRVPGTCAACHADEDHMQAYSIATSQYQDYEGSVHWQALSVRGDLSAPTCATCHGNHGAAPPGVENVEQVCATCHVVFANAFDESPHKQAFAAMGLPACPVCHENHAVLPASLAMLGVSEGAVCVNCHGDGEDAYDAADQMRTRLDELGSALQESRAALDRAEESGMEISEGRLRWADANEQLVLASVQVHTFQLGPVDEAVESGLEAARAARLTGAEALEERDFRRMGLGFSLISIAFVIAGLLLAIRSLDRQTGRT